MITANIEYECRTWSELKRTEASSLYEELYDGPQVRIM